MNLRAPVVVVSSVIAVALSVGDVGEALPRLSRDVHNLARDVVAGLSAREKQSHVFEASRHDGTVETVAAVTPTHDDPTSRPAAPLHTYRLPPPAA